MSDWTDPDTYAELAHGTAKMFASAALVLTGIDKLKKRRAKREEQERDAKNLRKDVDRLDNDLKEFIDLMFDHVRSHGQFVESLHKLLDQVDKFPVKEQRAQWLHLAEATTTAIRQTTTAIKQHGQRLTALESARAKPKQKRRKRK